MIEVLVTIVILTFGIFGLVGLQARMQSSEMESYQRSQALIILSDMASRLSANRNDASNYVTGADNPVGTGHTCSFDSASTRQVQDTCEWSNAIQGAAERIGSSKVGAFIGGRGCVESLGANEYLITVTWQGLGPVSAPPESVACGRDLYNDTASGAVCQNDLCRRTMTTIVHFASLS